MELLQNVNENTALVTPFLCIPENTIKHIPQLLGRLVESKWECYLLEEVWEIMGCQLDCVCTMVL